MMGVQETPARLFYDFCLDEHVPCEHLLRGVDRHLDLANLRRSLKLFYSYAGYPASRGWGGADDARADGNPLWREAGLSNCGQRLWRQQLDCDVCELKAQCCPNAVARKIPRDLHEDARDVARALAATPEYEAACGLRKKVEMLLAHLKRILRLAPCA
jgi:hypothetical protein